MSEYNGHESYEYWNTSLWFSNDEGLYNLALEARSGAALWDACQELELTSTPDGVELNEELVTRAWQDVHE